MTEQPKKKPCKGCDDQKSCIECVEKHLGDAVVLMTEIQQGYSLKRLRFVGSLSQAEQESLIWPRLSNTIRAERKLFQQSPPDNPYWPNFANLASLLEEARKQATPEQLTAEGAYGVVTARSTDTSKPNPQK